MEKTELSDIGVQPTNIDSTSALKRNDTVPKECQSVSENNKKCEVYDIGNYIGTNIDDFSKRQILLNHWSPPKDYQFPYSEHNKKGKLEKRYAGHKYMLQFDWLVFSNVKQGYFCKFCPLFVTSHAGGYQKNVQLKKLVTEPLKNFAKLLGKEGYLYIHSENDYHKNAIESAKNFLKCAEQPDKIILNQLDSQRLQQIEENRSRLRPIVQTVIVLGKQNVPLRGHRENGNICENSSTNEDNFREFLRFKLNSGDKDLKEHLLNASSRSTYISKTTQNEIIRCCGDEIVSNIIVKIQEAKYFSIIFDETTDISHQSQLTFLIRYVHDNIVREDFLQFLDLRKESSEKVIEDQAAGFEDIEPIVSGKDIEQSVLGILKKHSLDPKNCVGIATDGCRVMVSELCGAVAEIKK